ncbi:MAG TPA: hypothetical protein VF774_11510 [Pseudoduganella sp.]|jgi:hypothetical protein
MIPHLSDLPTILAEAHCSFAGWTRLTGLATLALAVVALEIWLRVPVRPVFDQLLARLRQSASRAA